VKCWHILALILRLDREWGNTLDYFALTKQEQLIAMVLTTLGAGTNVKKSPPVFTLMGDDLILSLLNSS
jgi:hypothetical protein